MRLRGIVRLFPVDRRGARHDAGHLAGPRSRGRAALGGGRWRDAATSSDTLSIHRHVDSVKGTRFVAANAPMDADACLKCTIRRRGVERAVQRCFAPQSPASMAAIVPVVGVLFRCELAAASGLAAISSQLMAGQPTSGTKEVELILAVMRTFSSRAKRSMHHLCRAWHWLRKHDDTVPPEGASKGWPTQLIAGLGHLRLNPAFSTVDLRSANASTSRPHSANQDTMCALPLDFMRQLQALGHEELVTSHACLAESTNPREDVRTKQWNYGGPEERGISARHGNENR